MVSAAVGSSDGVNMLSTDARDSIGVFSLPAVSFLEFKIVPE
jgi:hypothetical protein